MIYRVIFLTILLVTVTGCGNSKEGAGPGSEPGEPSLIELPALNVELEQDDLYTKAEFWEEVVRKVLVWHPENGEALEFAWNDPELANLVIDRSGVLEFLGLGPEMEVLVKGVVEISFPELTIDSRQKNLVIYLERQEYDGD